MEAKATLEQYHGNCHCGLFRFTIKIPKLRAVDICKCSICTQKAYLWIWPVAHQNLRVHCGDGELKRYESGPKNLLHFFCPTCGSAVMAKKKDVSIEQELFINARMLEIDIVNLEHKMTAGIDCFEPPYKFSEREQWHGEVEEGMVILDGGCVCGAVKYSVKTEPLEKQKIISCNCSMCSRNGDVFIYPKASSVRIDGAENLTGYGFLSQTSLHSFCKDCGVSVLVQVIEEGEDICPINIRTIKPAKNIDSLAVIPYDGKKNAPQYIVGEKRADDKSGGA